MNIQQMLETVKNFPKTIAALFVFVLQQDPASFTTDEKVQLLQDALVSAPFKLVEFFKFMGYNIGTMPSPMGTLTPWVSTANQTFLSHEMTTSPLNGIIMAGAMAAAVLENTIPDVNPFIPDPLITNDPNDATAVTDPNALKVLTKDDVFQAALTLAGVATPITTVEVKLKLRADGFRADQRPVSDFMNELSDEHSWQWDFNGTYRNYYVPAPTQDDEDDSNTTPATSTPPAVVSTSKKFDIHTVGNWVCRDKDNQYPSLSYMNESWYNAKRMFGRKYEVKYYDVRIKKA